MLRRIGPTWMQRLVPLIVALLVIPAAMSISVFLMEQPIRVGEESPRTVVAPDLIRIPDPDATDRAKRSASAAVEPVVVDDPEAKAAIVQAVRDAFAATRATREPDSDGRQASPADQRTALREQLPMLDEGALRLLISLTDEELTQTATEAISSAQQFARQGIPEDRVEAVAQEQLTNELVVRSFPDGVATTVVEPILRGALRPTLRVDEAASAQARSDAADNVAEVVRSFPAGSVVVSAGEPVDEIQLAALRQRGLEGAEPWRVTLRAFLLAGVLTVALGVYLRTYRTRVWRSTRRMLLLPALYVGFALAVEAVSLLSPSGASAWHYLVPVGAVAMLATMLFDPPIGVLSAIPTTALVAFEAPGEPGAIVFAAVASLLSVPLVSRLSARGDLRRAAWQSTLLYGVLAVVFTAIFADWRDWELALLAGVGNGVLTAMIVNTSLPFLESSFGIVTATGLLDLADRNHPLLRELEQKALGSYNHSIVVSTLVERAARSIGADALLGSVAALYHDIGKVRRPWFFVENQFGIANPHDDLEPEVSAVIIQEHVTDGIVMARSFRLPPEVVEGIATHHGTTLVTYFHRKAQEHASGSTVDEAHFRYKGRKPRSKEMAILMLADCCEGATRAAAQHNRNLSTEDLRSIVHGLVADRVEDGQLDDSALTFGELKTVTASIIETLEGVYHPRIPYPEPIASAAETSVSLPAETSTGAPEPPPAGARR